MRTIGAMNVLITGGSGYIGSHTVRALLEHGNSVVVIDRHRPARPEATKGASFVIGDLRDGSLLDRVFAAHPVDTVIHIAADKSVEESVRDPEQYFRNNVGGTLELLSAMVRAGVRQMVFSSSCAVYGTPDSSPITESTPTRPENPYGESKLMCERMLPWFEAAHGMRYLALRYFNAAGAALDAVLGEEWTASVNLIPVAIKAAMGLGPPIQVFGTDFPTPDGTGIRDYIHVLDLADGHVSGINYLAAGGSSATLNLGTGVGTSVRQVLDMIEEVSGRQVPHRLSGRRAGDPSAVWADSSLARMMLGWDPRFGLREIIETAWRWHESSS